MISVFISAAPTFFKKSSSIMLKRWQKWWKSNAFFSLYDRKKNCIFILNYSFIFLRVDEKKKTGWTSHIQIEAIIQIFKKSFTTMIFLLTRRHFIQAAVSHFKVTTLKSQIFAEKLLFYYNVESIYKKNDDMCSRHMLILIDFLPNLSNKHHKICKYVPGWVL